MSEFMKTVLKTLHQNSGNVLKNRLENVHKYDHVVPRVLSTSGALNRVHTMPIQAFEVAVNEPNKAKLELTLIIWFAAALI